ncbi:MAG: DUF1800 domain-containing protein [Cytophagaceae bacterium]|nr:DUF1800 domain-containing protein [Cytophagaceae bacterium]
MREMTQQTKIQHLFWRAGFGATPQDVQAASKKSIGQLVGQLVRDAQQFQPLEHETAGEPGYNRKALRDMVSRRDQMPTAEKREMLKDLIKENRGKIGDLNYQWLTRMGAGESALREKMTLFWHGHFACRVLNPAFVQQQNNVLRQHALGKFGDLLLAVSRDPAMLQFLNNQQNKKQSPNENFAREVMELFTLGRSNYTERDIKEAARAFTGWGFNPLTGEAVFWQIHHDEGVKTVFGKTGNFKGEDILKLILDRPETSRFLVTKIYRYFVNDTPHESHVRDLAQRFHRTDYDITDLMRTIFTADWFYEPRNVGVKIKSPVELLAGLQRSFGVEYGGKQSVLVIQKALDQVLFYPPNVAGWPGGRAWIDSSSLLLRMKLPEIILRGAQLNFKAKEDGDVNTEHLSQKDGKIMNASVDWPAFETAFNGLRGQALLDALSGYLLQHPLAPAQRDLILKKANENPVRDMALAIMTLPEYQLC